MLVRGSAQIAVRFGVSSLVIGLTVVAFGTSAPELAVSVQSVSAGAPDFAIGNVVGSNIFNILFILGASAVIGPLLVSRRVVWVEVPLVIGVSIVTWWLARDGEVEVRDGMLLLAVVLAYTVWLLRSTSREPQNAASGNRVPGVFAATTSVVAGLALLVVGALRDMAVGNVLGSNMFNLTIILGTTAVTADEVLVPTGVVTFDLVVMVAVAIACLPIFITGHRIARWEVPLTVVTVVVLAARGLWLRPHELP